ncbi:MAG: glutamine--tRNA ligase/YqeY domain fusion protein [Gemmatimonadales bacterium]
MTASNETRATGPDFIRAMVARDVERGKWEGRVATRFPPEPNGYLHVGHAKAICLNFGLANAYPQGTCNLRFDDSNPLTEDVKYVEAIKRDVRWLGFDWGDREYYASDYFEQLFDFAVTLIDKGKAYVDSSTEAEIRELRGTVTEPGRESPYRSRSVAENHDLFERMRRGEFPNGSHVLRARIDMAHPNMLMRDPLLYRIRHAHHYRRGDAWCIYPLYDFTHCLSDAIEGITHSLCTLEFKDNRELYDWIVSEVGIEDPPEQTEFARLNLDYTVLSKRKLVRLVDGRHVSGWDDPRMPTLAGLRRRGVTPEAIRKFCDDIGVARTDSRLDIRKLEHTIRDDLNLLAPRVLCVLRPLRVVIENYPEGQVEQLDAPSYPHDVPREGSRTVPFSRVLYIERDDFHEDPPKGFFRLAPGREVRLRYAYYVTCGEVVKDETGRIVEVRCTYDPATMGGGSPDGRKVKGTLHWVSAEHSLPAEVRLYDRPFTTADPEDTDEGEEFTDSLNPDSLVVLPDSRIEPSVADDPPGTRYQFERQGYFVSDTVDSKPGALVFNRTVGLRDTWAKIQRKATRSAVKTKPGARGARSDSGVRAAPEPAGAPGRGDGPERYMSAYGLAGEQAGILGRDPGLAALFEDAVAAHDNPKGVASWVVNDVRREAKRRAVERLPFDGAQLGRLVALIDSGTIHRAQAKVVLGEMFERGGDPDEIVRKRGLEQLADADALTPMIERVLAEYPEKVEQYRSGRTGLLGFFVGQVMKLSRGKANPKVVEGIVRHELETR